MRLSRVVRQPEEQHDAERVSLRAGALWLVVGIAIAGGLLLYFRFERSLVPILG